MGSLGTVAKELGGMPVKWTRRIEAKNRDESKARKKSGATKKQIKTSTKTIKRRSRHKEGEHGGDNERNGHEGIGKHLPDSHALQGNVSESLQKDLLPAGKQLRPVASTPRALAETIGDELGNESDHMAIELAEDTGKSVARAGEALLKGRLYYCTLIRIVSANLSQPP